MLLPTHTPVQPGFYVSNWLFLGKVYVQLGKKAEAREWLSRAAGVKSEDPKDVVVRCSVCGDVKWFVCVYVCVCT